MTYPCRMDAWCATRDNSGPAPAENRGFCWQDEKHGQHAIRQLVLDYVTLVAMTPKDAGGSGTASIPGNRAEAPIPMHLGAEALARQLVWTVSAAAVRVAEVARLFSMEDQGVRPGVAMRRGVTMLTRHYSALLALGDAGYLPYVTNEDDVRTSGSLRPIPIEMDGPGFVVELVRLHHTARSATGLTRRRERRALPCPAKSDDPETPGGCSTAEHPMFSLSKEVGGDVVECDNCGWSCWDADYDLYTMTFRAPSRSAA